ncbi:hypothetical protein QJS66_19105 [Kocuria rhizophila]|nr:hypothetical protein QJS66_19105 [Kocuria rhizophila]
MALTPSTPTVLTRASVPERAVLATEFLQEVRGGRRSNTRNGSTSRAAPDARCWAWPRRSACAFPGATHTCTPRPPTSHHC